ncbi:MAG: hypothetical protein DRJ43_02805 [Thermoprotei archaeon]|nr:MAG: hypothetical protein DRJ43_02805 [Thermoprotei archaeon]
MEKYRAKLVVRLEKPIAEAAYQALLVEAASQPTRYTSVRLRLEECSLILELSSDKRAAFRAALNGFMRLLAMIDAVAGLAGD